MCTVRIDIPCPGTLAPISSDIPSFGWTWMSRTFGRRPSAAVSSNGGGGARLNWVAIVVSRRGGRFPLPPENGVVGPRPFPTERVSAPPLLGGGGGGAPPPPPRARASLPPTQARPYCPRC